jgi:hypothetical protein
VEDVGGRPVDALSLILIEAAVHGGGQLIGRLSLPLHSDVVVPGDGMSVEVAIDGEEGHWGRRRRRRRKRGTDGRGTAV